ncbi:MAG TPA: SRPBCC family protein [Planctomycetota bacterium]|nr:SRPBCC family protein [Planctomycetota bacterium]HPF13945.1 SRPBCC family protein [Planctomycetota bacterium]HRV80221.1 SRPBCC family protein [Planctomycetota bacterium]
MTTTTDSVHKEIVLRAPRSRVWRALTNTEEFNTWFGAKLEGPFEPKARVSGAHTSCGHEGLPLELWIERLDPETYFSYRWHPYAIQPGIDYSTEPTTLVEFRLEEVKEGTRLTVVESGFDQLSAERRDEALPMHEGGWVAQLKNIEGYVASH